MKALPTKLRPKCREWGCFEHAQDNSPWCAEHQPLEINNRQINPNLKEFRRLRKVVLARNPHCVYCLKIQKITPATDVDHIVALRNGGSNDLNNLQSLCRKCHSRKTMLEVGYHGGDH